MNKRRVSVVDIAKKVGISTATVSRVINHPDLVNEGTKSLVQQAMKDLGYEIRKPIPTAKHSSSEKVVLINVPQLNNPFYGEVFRGIDTSLYNHDLKMLVSQDSLKSESDIDSFLELGKFIHICGLILCSPLKDPDEYHKLGENVPLVQCCEYSSEEFSYVSIDDYRAATSAMEHIYSQGRKKIAFVNGPLDFKYANERQRAYYDFMHRMSLETLSSWCINLPEINFDIAFASICQLLQTNTRPDAIFAASDLIAAAALKAARQYHLNIPNDLIVVGFDNIDISQISYPTITTVNQPGFQIGYSAGEILYDHMTSRADHPQHILLGTDLIIRQSSVPRDDYKIPSVTGRAETPLAK